MYVKYRKKSNDTDNGFKIKFDSWSICSNSKAITT